MPEDDGLKKEITELPERIRLEVKFEEINKRMEAF
jgi:hypothetical protein